MDDDEELGDEELSLLEPAPAEPLGDDELELDGELLDEEPPLALSFFCVSLELEDELDGVLGELVVPEAELEDEPGVVALGELVEPEPEGVVALEEEPLDGVREALSGLLQPAMMAPPNARETARARVESFMWPPWLGYGKEAARIGPRILRSHPAADGFTYFVVGVASGLFGPAWSPFCWKSRCWAADFGSTWPCCGFAPSRLSEVVGVPAVAGVAVPPVAAWGAEDEVSVFGDGVRFALRSQPAANASDRAATKVSNLIRALR